MIYRLNLLAVVLCVVLSYAIPDAWTAPREIKLKGEVGKVEVLTDDLQTELGFQVARSGNMLKITKIHPGSQASYKGLDIGDNVVQAKIMGSKVHMVIDRGGHIYDAVLNSRRLQNSLPPKPPAQASDKSQEFTSSEGQAKLSIEKDNDLRLKVLAAHDIVLLIDKSGSMATPDCPDGKTRWQWLSEQTIDLASRLAPYAQGNLTVIPFDSKYEVFPKVTLNKIREVFTQMQPSGSTDLYDPLKDQINDYLRGGHGQRPLVIAVITDGLPTMPQGTPDIERRLIIDTTLRLTRARDLTITFLQIGEFGGAEYLVELDDDLVNQGAKFDIVDTKTFLEIQNIGFVKALTDAILSAGRDLPRGSEQRQIIHNQTTSIRRHIKNYDFPGRAGDLQNVRDERLRLEQELLKSGSH